MLKPAAGARLDAPAAPSLAWCYFVTFFVLGMVPAAIGPTLLSLADQTGAALQEISILFAMRSLGYLCAARLIGGIFDRRSGHPVMVAALCLTVLLLLSIPLWKSLMLMSGVFLFLGVFGVVIDIGGNVLLVRAFHHNTGPYLSGLHFSFGFGAVTAPLLVAFILTAGQSPVFVYWIIGLLSIPGIIWLYRTQSPRNPYRAREEASEESGVTIPVWLVVAFFFLYGGCEASLGGWIHTYGIKQNAMHETSAAYLTSSFWGAFTLGRLLAIPIAARFRARTLIRTQLSATALVMFALFWSPPNDIVTWGSSVLSGLCMSSVFPLAISFFERFTAGSGNLTSWFFVGASSGSMTMPWLIGQYIEKIGPSFFTGIIVLGISAGALIITYISWRWSKEVV